MASYLYEADYCTCGVQGTPSNRLIDGTLACYTDINPEHGQLAMVYAKRALSSICTGSPAQFRWQHVLAVLPNLMDNMYGTH
jgi:hypothetical protein